MSKQLRTIANDKISQVSKKTLLELESRGLVYSYTDYDGKDHYDLHDFSEHPLSFKEIINECDKELGILK